MTTLRQGMLAALAAGEYWEKRGMGAPGLVLDFAELAHPRPDIKAETERIRAEIELADDDEFLDRESVEGWLHDWELVEPPAAAQSAQVESAGADRCAEYLDERGIDHGDDTESLWFAVYVDRHESLVKAFGDIAAEVLENEL